MGPRYGMADVQAVSGHRRISALLNQIFQENTSVLALFVEVNGDYIVIIQQVPSDRDGIKSCPGPK
jgi:hypothetical protein